MALGRWARVNIRPSRDSYDQFLKENDHSEGPRVALGWKINHKIVNKKLK